MLIYNPVLNVTCMTIVFHKYLKYIRFVDDFDNIMKFTLQRYYNADEPVWFSCFSFRIYLNISFFIYIETRTILKVKNKTFSQSILNSISIVLLEGFACKIHLSCKTITLIFIFSSVVYILCQHKIITLQ